MKVSVVTPSFNHGRFIGNCINSVRNQTGDFSVEHIIFDNCSSDGTAALLTEYKANPGAVDVKIVIEPDEGQTAAINKGFGMATGDVVCWLNTDEYYANEALAKVVEFFAEHPEIGVVFGNSEFVDEAGVLVKRRREYFFSESMLLYYGCFIPSCATFVRRKIIDAGIIPDAEIKVAIEFDWYLRISRAGFLFAHMPATLASFTWHEGNISITQVARMRYERRLIQDRYSGIKGGDFSRTWIYGMMRYFWIGVRVLRRAIG